MVIHHAELDDGQTAVVEIDGPLDSLTSPDFENYINKLLGKNIPFILFDAKNMGYVSSEGIGLLLFLQKKISDTAGFFVFFNLSGEIMTLFSLLGFDRKFLVADSRQNAELMLKRQIEMRKSGVPEKTGARTDSEAFAEARASEPRFAPAEQDYGPDGTVVACDNCTSQVRVYKDGEHRCPHCNTEFTVANRRIAHTRDEGGAVTAAGAGSLVIECATCKSLIRIKKSGNYRCPDCKTRFTVARDLTVVF